MVMIIYIECVLFNNFAIDKIKIVLIKPILILDGFDIVSLNGCHIFIIPVSNLWQ